MRKINISLMAITITCLFACSDDDSNFTPGPEPSANNIGAYFASGYEEQTIYAEAPTDEEDAIHLTVVRLNTEAAAKIPIIVDKADTAIHVPEYVEFKAGEDSVNITISSPYITQSKVYDVALHLDEDYCNPYADVEGGSTANFAIVWGEWGKLTNPTLYKQCVDRGLIEYSEDSTMVLDSIEVWVNSKVKRYTVETVAGLNRFRINNFLDSDTDLDFSLENFVAEEPGQSGGKITINSHFFYNDNTGCYSWGKDGWEPWVPFNFTQSVSYIDFYPVYQWGTILYEYNNIDFYVNKPYWGKSSADPKYRFVTDNDAYHYGIELAVINNAWVYIYFYPDWKVVAKADL